MSEIIKIEKGVPLPERRSKYPVLEMEVGDSVVLKTLKRVCSMRVSAEREGIKLTARRQEDGTYRVWRKS